MIKYFHPLGVSPICMLYSFIITIIIGRFLLSTLSPVKFRKVCILKEVGWGEGVEDITKTFENYYNR